MDHCWNTRKKLNEILESENLNCSTKTSVLSQEYKTFKGTIKWYLRKSDLNFNAFGESKECHFSIGSPDFCKLCLRIFPSGTTENTKNFVSLSVCFRNPPPIYSWYGGSISFLNESGDILKSDRQSKSEENLNVIDFNCFTEKRKLEDFCKNSKLIIQCIVNISCNYFYCKTDDLEHSVKESQEVKTPPKVFFDKIPSDAIIETQKEEISINKALISIEMPTLRILFRVFHEGERIFTLPKDLNVRPMVFKEVVDFVYTGNITFKGFKHACEVYDSACLFKMKKLKDICSAYISANVQEKNVFLSTVVAQKFSDEELLDACYEFIKKCNSKTLAHSSLLSLDKI